MTEIRNLAKYAQLKEVLRLRIERGEYRAHSPLPTQRALMERYRLSFSTVRRALEELIREGAVYSRPGKGIFVADRKRKPNGRKLVFTLIGIKPEWFDVHARGWIAGLLRAQHDFDFLMQVAPAETFAQMEADLRAGKTPPSDGAIILYLAGSVEPLVRLMHEVRFPYVILDMPLRGTGVNAVVIDHEAGAFDAVTHLIRRGHRRIAFVGGAPGEDASRVWFNAKYWGYLRALKTAGLEARPEDVFLIQEFEEAKVADYAREAVRDLLLPKRGEATGAFVSIEAVARAVLRELVGAGVRVPDELAVVGFNDHHAAEPGVPGLTTVDVPMEEVGPEAVRMLIAQIEGKEPFPQQRILHGRLIVRESSGGGGNEADKSLSR